MIQMNLFTKQKYVENKHGYWGREGGRKTTEVSEALGSLKNLSRLGCFKTLSFKMLQDSSSEGPGVV